jgi:hypothetical protein
MWNQKIVNNIVTLISHFPFCPLHDNFAHQTEKTFIQTIFLIQYQQKGRLKIFQTAFSFISFYAAKRLATSSQLTISQKPFR